MESAAAEERVYAFREVRRCVMCGGSAFRPLGRRLDRSQGARPRRKTGLSVSVQRCQTCGLIFPQPLPVPQTLAQHYDLPADEYWSAERVAGAGPTFASEVSTTLELLGRTDSSGLTALDIGAGFGATLRALGEAGFDAVGVEPMVGDTFVPWPLDPLAKGVMRATGTGLQLTVWLRKS